ncbi:hypothetical protein CPC08DRAFT_823500 [Agrocybe pediades]|nr:hypothetical protein CPC08DRAFT_823500 [Agrocybe pediades]
MASTPVDLPQLESLQIFSRYYEEVLALLECIMPSPQCSLFTSCLGKITRYDSEGDEVWISPSKVYDAIIRWMLVHAKIHPWKFIWLWTMDYSESGCHLDIRDSEEHPLSSSADQGGMPVGITVELDSYGRHCLQELVSSGIFSTVERLQLTDSAHVVCSFFPLYQAFHSVTELVIEGALFMIPQHKNAALRRDLDPPLFPRLRALILIHSAERSLDEVVEFLEHRVEIGLPVAVLDLRGVHIPTDDDRRERLGKIKGLLIRWRATRRSPPT